MKIYAVYDEHKAYSQHRDVIDKVFLTRQGAIDYVLKREGGVMDLYVEHSGRTAKDVASQYVFEHEVN